MRGYSSKYRNPELKKGKFRRRFLMTAIIVIVLYFILFLRVGQILNKGEKLIYAEQYDQAFQTFSAAEKYILRKARVSDAKAIAHLAMAQHSQAEEIFLDLKEKRFKSSTFDGREILEFFLNRGHYLSLRIYGEHLQSWKKFPELPFYLLLSYNGLNEIEKAESLLADCKKIEALKKRIDFQEHLLNEKKKSGYASFLFDRKGKMLLGTSLKDGDIINQAGYAEILENESFLASFLGDDRRNRMILTLDLNAQKMAEEALGRYAGAFVALKPGTGEIIAAYSSEGKPHDGPGKTRKKRPRDPKSIEGIKAFEKALEPGSIMKVVTLAGAIDKGFDYSALFPFRCEGFLGIDDTLFYDWIKHGELSDVNEAMAASCNIFFATVGMHLKEEHLHATLSDFGFNSRLSEFPLPSMLGRLDKNTGTKINLFVANRSVGLENIDLTALHAAMIASAFANDGKIMKPIILKEKRNIEKKGYFVSQPEILFQPIRSETALFIAETMLNSVESDAGTSRRARIEGLKVALKTGTSGEPSQGLDAWMIGFAPYENPEIAFAFVAEHAGKAEIAGAKIAKKFLTSYLHERLVPQN